MAKPLVPSLLVALLLTPSFPQPIESDKEAAIRRLLDLTHTTEVLAVAMEQAMRPTAQQLRQFVSPDQGEEFESRFAKRLGDRLVEQIVEAITVPAFNRYFTQEEIGQLLELWESPVAQRFVETQLRMVHEIYQTPEFQAVVQQVPQIMREVVEEMEGDYPGLAQVTESLRQQPSEAAPGVLEALDGTEYVNRTDNFRLTAPDGWSIQEELRESPAALVGLVSIDEGEFALVQREPFEGSLEDYKAVFLENHREDLEGLQVVREEEVELAGRPGLEFVFVGEEADSQIQQIVVVVKEENGDVTAVRAGAEAAEFDEVEPVLQALVRSYRPLTQILPADREFEIGPDESAIRVGGEVQTSKLIDKVDPIYPEAAKEARISGMVLLMAQVDESGHVVSIRPVEGDPLLTEAAIEAVRQWRYSPTLLEGEPVSVIATVSVNFVLR